MDYEARLIGGNEAVFDSTKYTASDDHAARQMAILWVCSLSERPPHEARLAIISSNGIITLQPGSS